MIPSLVNRALIQLPGIAWIRRALFTPLLVFTLAGAPLCEAGPSGLQASRSPAGSLTLAEGGAEVSSAVAMAAEADAGAAVSMLPVSGAEQAVTDERKDLTMFFSIGVILDVLLVAAFLIWAVGQWRKARK